MVPILAALVDSKVDNRLPQHLPTPHFSLENPYWHPVNMDFLRPEYRPRLNAQNFLFAATWEMYGKKDHFGAGLVRQAMQRTLKLNLDFGRIKYKELANAKQV